MIKMTEEEFVEHYNDYNGVCLECQHINYGGHEPDAKNYLCKNCGKKSSFGMEEALLEGFITFSN
jgi:hypothetical protein